MPGSRANIDAKADPSITGLTATHHTDRFDSNLYAHFLHKSRVQQNSQVGPGFRYRIELAKYYTQF